MLHASVAPQSVILGQSGVAVSHTGDTNEFTFATVTIPAGAMGANGAVEIVALWSYTNSANNKTLKLKFGDASPTTYLNVVPTTTASAQTYTRIANRNSAASQVGSVSGSTNAFAASASAVVTGTEDTSADVAITLTGQLASAGESITLESYIVRMIPRA